MEFLNKLQAELRPGINEILEHPFLKRIHDATLTESQLKFFVEQYHVYNSYFPRLLSALAANITDDRTRMPIVENLWEEHGSGVLKDSHRMLFENFAASVGLTPEDLKNVEPLSTTAICCDHLLDTCMNEDFITSLGALGPGTEYFTKDEYYLIVEGLSKYPTLGEKELEFWIVHISLDEDHYSDMLEAIKPWCNTSSNRHKVKVGAKKAIDLEILFWDGLEEEVINR